MTPLKDLVEWKAKELHTIGTKAMGKDFSFDEMSPRGQLGFEAIAKHVIASELRAKLEAISHVPAGMFDSRPYIKDMMEEINEQLSQLEKL